MAFSMMTEKEVAEALSVSLACLRRWRREGRGPSHLKLGRLVRYPADALSAFCEAGAPSSDHQSEE